MGIRLLAAQDAYLPGEWMEIALALKIEDGWHAYWKNPGDSGLPPQVFWDEPEKFEFEGWQFPVPEYYSQHDQVTHNLPGEPVLLGKVRFPKGFSGDRIELKGTAQVLVCKQLCIMIRREVNLSVPVAKDPAQIKPANKELFEEAHSQLPKRPSDAKYLKFRPVANVDRVIPGGTFRVALALDVEKGYHLQSNKPLSEDLIPTRLFAAGSEGLAVGYPSYPEGRIVTEQGQRISLYKDQVVISVEIEADSDIKGSKSVVDGILTYQACTDKGRCFPPIHVAWAMELPVGKPGEKAKAVNEAVFGAASPPNQAEAKSDGAVAADQPPEQTDAATAIPDKSDTVQAAGLAPRSLLWYLFAAALGGLILNIMPCVLPVISIKILSFVQQAGEHPRRVFELGLAFAAGILVSFSVLALIVIGLQSAGQHVGWGFQLSDPRVVIPLTSFIFLFAMSLFGVFAFNIPGRAATRLSEVEAREGLPGAFLKGVLATVLATPCTAPFLGSAVGYAFQQPPGIIFLIMLAVGTGMAFPYVLLTARPGWMRYLPKPGLWMERFKQFMGFVLVATTVWLLQILGELIGAAGIVWTLAFLTFVGLAAWLLGIINLSMSSARQWGMWGAAAAVVIVGWQFSFGYMFDIETAWKTDHSQVVAWEPLDGLNYEKSIPWQPWAPGRAEQLAEAGYTVYIDYTATWCLTCQTNKAVVLETDAVRRKMKELKVVPIKADYTKQPPEMHQELLKHNRAGVPLNIVYPAGHPENAYVLPEQLVGHQSLVLETLDKAGQSHPSGAVVSRRAEQG